MVLESVSGVTRKAEEDCEAELMLPVERTCV